MVVLPVWGEGTDGQLGTTWIGSWGQCVCGAGDNMATKLLLSRRILAGPRRGAERVRRPGCWGQGGTLLWQVVQDPRGGSAGSLQHDTRPALDCGCGSVSALLPASFSVTAGRSVVI